MPIFLLRCRADAARSLGIALMGLLAWTYAPPPAQAQVDFVAHGELGGAAMLSSYQRHTLGFDNGLTAMVRPGLRFANFFDIELSVGALWFPTTDVPTTQGLGRIFLAGGGIRFEPMLGSVGRLVLDGHVSYAYTGPLSRLSFDAGLAFEFQAGDYVGIGPYARYTHVLASGPSDGGDAMMISYGLSISIGSSTHDSAVDSDGDGVFDDDDLCLHEPAGRAPDPQRAGCPLPDADHDGVVDADDVCPHDPAGSHPDPHRRGCPLTDMDGDGIYDADDLCPNEAQGTHPDPSRAGCPLSDADDDGIYDAEDACPTTPAGATPDPTRPGCPDGDDDGDAVLNASDACRTEHAGLHPDAARLGCPMADGDHDMIPDASDACPAQPGAPSSNPRRNGCPGLIVMHVDSISIERPVFFATGRDTILRRSTQVLTALADALRLTPEIHGLSIEGHTDDVGDEAANLDLSRRRAESVMAWLVAHGVDASRLRARGMGETHPTAEGTSRDARDQNRSVEFRVLSPDSMTDEGGSR
jgi:outer membrane protein OmpA-like peptidoglycan-associated protein